MYKKSFFLTAALSLTIFTACQPDPTPVDSTVHQHANQNKQGAGHHDTAQHGITNTAATTSDHSGMNHGDTQHGNMQHSEMKSAPDAANQPYDLQFLDTMIAHHQGAVEMAKMVEGKTENAELRKFAAQIIADQDREIAQMRQWREQWFAGRPSALNMEMPGMRESMKMDMTKLTAARGAEFDRMFYEMMIPHHEGAITMSREALNRGEHAEIKTLADQIIKSQEAEIRMMRERRGK